MSSQGEVLPAFFLPLILDNRNQGPGAPLLQSSRAPRRRRGADRGSHLGACRGSGIELGESLAGSGIGIAFGRVKLRDRAREYCRQGIGGGEGEVEARRGYSPRQGRRWPAGLAGLRRGDGVPCVARPGRRRGELGAVEGTVRGRAEADAVIGIRQNPRRLARAPSARVASLRYLLGGAHGSPRIRSEETYFSTAYDSTGAFGFGPRESSSSGSSIRWSSIG